MKDKRWVVTSGSATLGFDVYGPFSTFKEAEAYRNKMTGIEAQNGEQGYGSYSVLSIWEPSDRGLPDKPDTQRQCGCCEHGHPVA